MIRIWHIDAESKGRNRSDGERARAGQQVIGRNRDCMGEAERAKDGIGERQRKRKRD